MNTTNATLTNTEGSTINNSASLTNLSGATLTNSGRLTNSNSGTINNSGILSSSRTIENGIGSTGIINNTGTLDNNYSATLTNGVNGAINSSGILNNRRNGTINNSGMLTNSGALQNSIGSTSASTINNTGTLSNATGATLTNGANGTINNSAQLTNLSGATLTNSGHLVNNNAGTINNSGNIISTGDITNSGNFLIANMGSVIGGGDFTQTAGSLVVNGSMTQSLIDIEGGTLSGSGYLSGTVKIGSDAMLNPGNSPGVLNITGDLFIDGLLNIEIASADVFDIINVSGTTTFGGNSQIVFNFVNAFMPTEDFTLDFFNSANVEGFDLVELSFGDNMNWGAASLENGQLQLAVSASEIDGGNGSTGQVPEPATIALLGIGFAGFGAARRRQLKTRALAG